MLHEPSKGLGRFYSYLNSAVKIIHTYKGNEPLAHFLKNYFSQQKKFGGRDRKQIANLCYSYYRLGKAFTALSFEQQVLLGLRLSSAGKPEPQWNVLFETYRVPEQFSGTVFPWKELLSATIDAAAFEQSFFIQPDLFLRIRPGNEAQVIEKLEQAALPFEKEGTAVRLPNTANISEVLSVNTEVVIQDLSSQKIGGFFKKLKSAAADPSQVYSVWDCCAASGGKSILATDELGMVELTVSDIRPSIIANLKKRFHEAGIKNFRSLVADAAKPDEQFSRERFDLVIADVPCSGSGTWSRTPEQLYYFEQEQLAVYTALQKKILKNSIRHIKPGGYLLYCTCSVFKAENEDQVRMLQRLGFEVVGQRVIAGYDKKADTLFGALLKKPGRDTGML